MLRFIAQPTRPVMELGVRVNVRLGMEVGVGLSNRI